MWKGVPLIKSRVCACDGRYSLLYLSVDLSVPLQVSRKGLCPGLHSGEWASRDIYRDTTLHPVPSEYMHTIHQHVFTTTYYWMPILPSHCIPTSRNSSHLYIIGMVEVSWLTMECGICTYIKASLFTAICWWTEWAQLTPTRFTQPHPMPHSSDTSCMNAWLWHLSTAVVQGC